jgi:molybdopterin molybdotransferase
MASVGKSNALAKQLPKVAVISTGDELVDIDQQPLPHQIRRSNSYALLSELKKLHCTPNAMHIRDDEKELSVSLRKALQENDVLILSGGVSKGKFDFVPQVLEGLGIKKLFHRVSQKPGKPFWFGADNNKTVFALPGNPVSTFMCFHKYVKPWLLKSLGAPADDRSAVLARDFSFPADLTYFLQVKIKNEEGKLMAHPHPGGGSGDFANLKEVDGFLELSKEQKTFRKGEVFPLLIFRS